MNTKSIQDETSTIQELRDAITAYDEAYYDLDEPLISDEEYDSLVAKLKALEGVPADDSPLAKPAGGHAPGFTRVKHDHPMLSVENTYSLEEVLDFDRDLSAAIDDFRYVLDFKVDGVALSLKYDENGDLVRALTRGDGSVGDDVTANAITCSGVPRVLPVWRWVPEGKGMELRGEVYISHSDLEALNAERELAGEKLFANARNTASGSLKLSDHSECAKRKLSFVAHGVVGDDLNFGSYSQVAELMEAEGIEFVQHRSVARADLTREIEEMHQLRSTLPYATDGVVIKVDSFNHRAELGASSRAPRWAIAYKFGIEQATTKVLRIDHQVGRTGAITPVAILDPVSVGGVTVGRATLHNADEIQRLGIMVGDWVTIERGGEVIPKVIEVVTSKRDGTETAYEFPTECPSCSGPISRIEGEAVRRCLNPGCPDQAVGKIVHFASRNALDIRGLGGSVAQRLYDAGMVKDVADLYTLNMEEVAKLEGMGTRSTQELAAELEKTKSADPQRLTFAVGIHRVGETVSRLLTQEIGGLAKIAEAKPEAISSISGLGTAVASAISKFFHTDDPTFISPGADLIHKLREAGLTAVDAVPEKAPAGGVLDGLTIVVTGSFDAGTRNEIEAKLRSLGAKTSGSVGKSTSLLLCGSSPGSKLAKAEKLGVKVVTGDEGFTKLCSGEL